MALILRHQRYSSRLRIPKAAQHLYEGRKFLQRNLNTSDRKVAQVEEAAWAAILKVEWAKATDMAEPPRNSLRAAYERIRREAEAGAHRLVADGVDPIEGGIDHEIEKMADAIGERDLTEAEAVQLAALQDALKSARGERVKPRREFELTFSELADERIKLWKTDRSLKDTNTEQQKRATFNLFAGFWKDNPIRGVRFEDAAAFHDQLRQLDPNWKRSPAAAKMTWAELQQAFGGKGKSLADATMNRHMATLKELWEWARLRGHCSGDNPFHGFHVRLTEGKNVRGYQGWEISELEKLLHPAPRRRDVTELIIVAMFTGMRLDEIASLTAGDIRNADGVDYINVIDAKTPAGIRRVPLHRTLGWLKDRAKGDPSRRIWPEFNPEGPGKKAGADAGKEFSRLKQARGFTTRTKAFHSFRSNVVSQLEERGVPVTEIAQLVGHEKPFTSKRYNKSGVSLRRLAEAVALIEYPKLNLPDWAMPTKEDGKAEVSQPEA